MQGGETREALAPNDLDMTPRVLRPLSFSFMSIASKRPVRQQSRPDGSLIRVAFLARAFWQDLASGVTLPDMSRPHLIVWLLVIAGILGCGWYKDWENRYDRHRRQVWEQRITRLQSESQNEYARLVDRLRELNSQKGSRQRVGGLLTAAGAGLHIESGQERDIATWIHPEYGIHLRMEFQEDRLVGFGAGGGGSSVLSIHPQPPSVARTSRAEAIRQVVATWGRWLWLIVLPLALVSRRYGLVAAEGLLAVAIACGAASLVSPLHTLSPAGIFSNDPLFFAALMYVTSVVCLALRCGPQLERTLPLWQKFRFRLRTLLVLIAATAVLLAMGPFGCVALVVLAIGSVLFATTLVAYSWPTREPTRAD